MRKHFYPVFIVALLLQGCAGPFPQLGEHARQTREMGDQEFFPAPVRVKTGLDVLVEMDLKPLQGKRVGVVTNQTAVARDGRHIVQILRAHPDVEVAAIFGPEHGWKGAAEGGLTVVDGRDSLTGAPVYSLYGKARKPKREMLEGVDILVFDIQDIGARFYTFISTLGYVLEAGAEYGIPVMVLDRPNPIGDAVRGPILDPHFKSFVGMYPIPIQHGMTVAELARMIQGEEWIHGAENLELHIVPLEGWHRDLVWTDLDLPWVDPSPNMRNPMEAMTYPGLCLLEGTNISEGRGTEEPFEILGAPWLDSRKLARTLWQGGLDGVTVEPVEYQPVSMPGYSLHPKYEGQTVHGIRVRVLDPYRFDAVAFGVRVIGAIAAQHPDEFSWNSAGRLDRLWGNDALRMALTNQEDPNHLVRAYGPEDEAFRILRQPYLLYEGNTHPTTLAE